MKIAAIEIVELANIQVTPPLIKAPMSQVGDPAKGENR